MSSERPGPDHEVAIIGAGPGGIASAHLLQQRGITDFVILERAADFGGTWRDNHYPGLAVDIPSVWYQFSFAPNPNWSRFFAPGPEINQYLRDTATKLDLYAHLRPHTNVIKQAWDDDASLWRLDTEDGAEVTARYLISSVGGYVNAKPRIDIEGIDSFGGTVLRPNDWDDSYPTAGKRIAVIGTGSSGVQIAGALAETAGSLKVFQRTPAWILPKVDFTIGPGISRLLKIPGLVRAANAGGRLAMDAAMLVPMFHLFAYLPDQVLLRLMPLYDGYCRLLYRLVLRTTVRDRATRKALVPKYGIMAKRPVISSAFLPQLNRPNTDLITTGIDRVTKNGIRTVDGVEHPVDLIVAATGYELWTDPETYRPGTVVGRDGFDLAQAYRTDGLRTYAGSGRPELPNRFEIVGPLGFVGFAWFDYIETTAGHAVRIIDEAKRRGAEAVAVTPQAFENWNDGLRRRARLPHLYVTRNENLNTYFLNSHGDTVYYRPQTITGARRFASHSPLSDYQFSTAAARPAITPATEISA